MIACDGLSVGQQVTYGVPNVDRGNTLVLREIPEGTLVYNIEGMPGDGGRFVRAAGTQAVVVSQGDRTVIQMPSGDRHHSSQPNGLSAPCLRSRM